jgi:hypothetical protein
MVEIFLKSTLDTTYLVGDFVGFIHDLNIAAASGKQYVIATEQRADGSTNSVAFETTSITKIRDAEDVDRAFIGV